MGQQVKLPPKMRGPNSFRNPDLWCEFHRDHGHKTEDYVALKIEVNELLQKGYLREFLSEKAKNLLSMETSRKSAETKPASPPRQDRVIHVISRGSEISGIRRFGDKRHKPCSRKEEHAKCQTWPGDVQIKTATLGIRQNKFHGKGTREGPSSPS